MINGYVFFKSTSVMSTMVTIGTYMHNRSVAVIMDSSLQSSYHSNELESRPKTKFFSLMIYAGYPMQ